MTTQTKNKTTSVDPSLLAPDFDNIDGPLVAEEYNFWLGLTADCPQGQIDVAGLHFPRSEEDIVFNEAGKQVRVPKHGTLNTTVTKYHFEELVRLLPRLVIRLRNAPAKEDGGENTGDPVQRMKGHLVKIPDAKAVTEAAAHGRTLKPYIKQPGDRPATDYMYFLHAPTGVRGAEIQTISDIGLEWPVEIQEVEDLLS